jgi:carbonic anhydrase
MKKPSFGLLLQAPLISALFLCGTTAVQADTLADNLAAMEAQSPIDIRPDNTYFGHLAPLQFGLSSDTSLSVINNGSPGEFSTVRANVNAGAGKLTLSGHDWNLAQFHFHTPSEHLVKGTPTPLEMHLVFSDASDNLLVVGRFIQAANNDHSASTALDSIFTHLPQTTSDTLNVDHFNLNTLLPDNLESFRYSGSLTTPPFSEGVSWVDLAQPLYMSGEQIDAFKSLFPEGNARDVQDLNGRIVLTDVPGFVTSIPEPETYAMLLAGLALIGFAARRKNGRLVKPGLIGSVA